MGKAPVARDGKAPAARGSKARWAFAAMLLLGAIPIVESLGGPVPNIVASVSSYTAPFQIANPYGLFAVMTTAYILIAIQLEERDLMAEHPEYKAYREQVPMLIPNFSRTEVPLASLATRDPRRYPVVTRML